mmetsp:Transcript_8831/g.18959  ORF Transcript_8831/g.18959 Transcript_8831/m.18959 type:complete len:347 (+) Transcript_8831:763-1803(+)
MLAYSSSGAGAAFWLDPERRAALLLVLEEKVHLVLLLLHSLSTEAKLVVLPLLEGAETTVLLERRSVSKQVSTKDFSELCVMQPLLTSRSSFILVPERSWLSAKELPLSVISSELPKIPIGPLAILEVLPLQLHSSVVQLLCMAVPRQCMEEQLPCTAVRHRCTTAVAKTCGGRVEQLIVRQCTTVLWMQMAMHLVKTAVGEPLQVRSRLIPSPALRLLTVADGDPPPIKVDRHGHQLLMVAPDRLTAVRRTPRTPLVVQTRRLMLPQPWEKVMPPRRLLCGLWSVFASRQRAVTRLLSLRRSTPITRLFWSWKTTLPRMSVQVIWQWLFPKSTTRFLSLAAPTLV